MKSGTSILIVDEELLPEAASISAPRLTLDPQMLTVTVDEITVELTVKEWQLLYFLKSNPDRLVTREEIREKFIPWGKSAGNIIDVYINYLRGKIGTGFIHTVRGEGYRFTDLMEDAA